MSRQASQARQARRQSNSGGCASCCGGCCDCKNFEGGSRSVYGGAFEGPSADSCPSCAPTSLVYFNVSLFNPQANQIIIPAQITDTRGTAVIDRPDDWEMSVVRFDVSSQLLPPIVAPMGPLPAPPPAAQPATAASQLTVTLTFGGVDHESTVVFNYSGPETFGYVFSFDELTFRINQALAASFAAIAVPPVGSQPPFLYFNAVTQMFQLFFQTADYGVAPLIEIWVNDATYKYIDSMPAFFAGIGQLNGKDFRLQVERDSAVMIPTPPGPGFPVLIQGYTGTLAYLTQAGPSLASTNGVRSVFLQTNLLPINSEALPITTSQAQTSTFSSNSTPIISDFLLSTDPASNPVVDRISISYLPTAEYRMVQLRGAEPVKQVDIKFFFTLFDGTVHELLLFPGGYCSAKLLFRRSERSTLRDSRL